MKLSEMAIKSFRVFFFALLLAASPLLQGSLVFLGVIASSFYDCEASSSTSYLTQMISGSIFSGIFATDELLKCEVARCQSEADDVGVGDLEIVGEDVQPFGDGNFDPAPGVETICVFPKNSAKLVVAGEETELLVGMGNVGGSPLNIIVIQASVHLPYDHRMLVQNLTAQTFPNASVSPSVQATFRYMFAVSKYLQAGTFDLVGTVVYEIDQNPYRNTFYNGTIEVIEAGGIVSVESVFLVTLGIALLVLLGLWLHGQFQRITKKTKKASKVETGTGTTDASLDEWLQGTAYTQSGTKSKKKK